MQLLKPIGLGIGVMLGLLGMVDLAVAQSMTEALQTDRMTVVEVNKAAGWIVSLNGEPRVVAHEVHNGALVVADDGQRADLGFLNAGDIIKAEIRNGRLHKIIVLRRAWAELASPE